MYAPLLITAPHEYKLGTHSAWRHARTHRKARILYDNSFTFITVILIIYFNKLKFKHYSSVAIHSSHSMGSFRLKFRSTPHQYFLSVYAERYAKQSFK